MSGDKRRGMQAGRDLVALADLLREVERVTATITAEPDSVASWEIGRALDGIALEAAKARTRIDRGSETRRGLTTYERVRRALGYMPQRRGARGPA